MTSASLVCSNTAYLYLSVPFIQMLKGLSPVFVLFLTWLWSLKQVTTSDILEQVDDDIRDVFINYYILEHLAVIMEDAKFYPLQAPSSLLP